MAHRNSSHWRSIVAGKPVPYRELQSVEELPKMRGAGHMEALAVDLPEVGQFHERVPMRGEGQTPLAEIYVPKGKGPFPVLIHFHGGAWVGGSTKGERKFCMGFAADGFLVVNVEYALAPENPFPRPLEDALYATRWVARNIRRYNGDPDRIAIGGASAGGNLAASTVLALHVSDEGLDSGDLAGVPVRLSALFPQFGVFDAGRWVFDKRYKESTIELYVMAYLGTHFTKLMRHPLVSPLLSKDLDKLPPTYLTCGDEDALLNHTLLFADAITQARVPTTVSVVQGADHEFLKVPDRVPGTHEELRRVKDWLRRQLK